MIKKLTFLFILLLIYSCNSVKHIDNKNTIIEKEILYDSIYFDKYHTVYTANDTIYIKDSIFLYKTHIHKDTLTIKDSVIFTNEIVVEKEIIDNKYKNFMYVLIGTNIITLLGLLYFKYR
jgi:hypothetical protein